MQVSVAMATAASDSDSEHEIRSRNKTQISMDNQQHPSEIQEGSLVMSVFYLGVMDMRGLPKTE